MKGEEGQIDRKEEKGICDKEIKIEVERQSSGKIKILRERHRKVDSE